MKLAIQTACLLLIAACSVSAQGLIVYHKYAGGNLDIYIADLNGENEQRLTTDPAIDIQPRLSPDGTRILFCSNRTGRVELFGMNTDGSGVTQISPDGIGETSNGGGTFVLSAWSPDGAFVLYGHETQLMRARPDGSEAVVLASAPDGRIVNTPDWSPTNNKISFRTYQPYWAYICNIYIMNPDGSDLQLLVADRQGGESGPRISPDGQRVLYSWDHSGHEEPSGRGLDHRIHIINIDGSNDIEISYDKPADTHDYLACWITNERIAFVNQGTEPNAVPSIWTMNADGTERESLIEAASEPDCGLGAVPCPPTPVPFAEEFEGSMESCWAWTDEDVTHWSLTERPGWLRIVTQPYTPGEAFNNLLLRRQPATSYSIETRVQIDPAVFHQGAGIIFWYDSDHFLMFHRQVGDWGQYVSVQCNDMECDPGFLYEVTEATDVYLRATIHGSTGLYEWSADGANWNELGELDYEWLGLPETRMGLFASNHMPSGAVPEIPADFEYFRITPPPQSGESFIAFDSYREGNNDIYSVNSDGQNVLRLTTDPAGDGQARISPDGNRIAFCSNRTGRVELFVMNADGSNVIQLSSNGVGETSNGSGTYVWSAWSPDGMYVLYGHETQLMRARADGTETIALAASPDGRIVNTPDWSLAGNKIAFRTYQSFWAYICNIYIMNPDGSDLQLLVADRQGGESGPRISPDGQRVLYSWDHSGHEEPSGRGLDHRLHVINIDGSNDVEISSGKPVDTHDYHGCWITNALIAFVNQHNAPNSVPYVYVMNADGSERELIVENGNQPDWYGDAPTAAPSQVSPMVRDFKLGANYPNPFNPSTTIPFRVDSPGEYTVTVYNVYGEVVRQLHHGMLNVGEHSVVWNGENQRGDGVSSGMYFYRLASRNQRVSMSMQLIK